MYDHRSRFNPSPDPPTLPQPSPAPALSSAASLRPPSNATTTYLRSPRVIPQRKLSDIQSNVKHQLRHQIRRRSLIWLTEAHMTRQLTRNVWKLQTSEERLVQDLGVVRAAIAEMLKDLDEMEERDDHDDGNEENEGGDSIRHLLLKGFMRGRLKPSTRLPPVPGPSNEQITAARSHLLVWQAIVISYLHHACNAVLTNSRTPIPPSDEDDLDPVAHAYEVLARVLAIRPTVADKMWFADLPSLGEMLAFGGLRGLPDGRAKAVVWHVAEVYAAFWMEKRARRYGEAMGMRTWIQLVVETGEALKESVLYEEYMGMGEEPPATRTEDMVNTEVIELCESFDQMRLVEAGSDSALLSSRHRGRKSKESRSSSSLLREKIEKLWIQGTGFVKEELCTSS